jgi:hypothetical protein
VGTAREFAAKAYEFWKDRDVGAVARLFGDSAMLAIPGRTRISGDHRGPEAVSCVLMQCASASSNGSHRQEQVCSYASDGGAMFVFDNFVTIGGKTEQYHSVHEWIARDGKLLAVMIYVHEYDVFERAWG